MPTKSTLPILICQFALYIDFNIFVTKYASQIQIRNKNNNYFQGFLTSLGERFDPGPPCKYLPDQPSYLLLFVT